MSTLCSSWYPTLRPSVAHFLDFFPENEVLNTRFEEDLRILHIKLDKISEGKIFFTAVTCGTRIFESQNRICRFKAFACNKDASSAEDLNNRITLPITDTLKNHIPSDLLKIIFSYFSPTEELLGSLYKIMIQTAHLSIRMKFWAQPTQITEGGHQSFLSSHPFKFVKETECDERGFRGSFFNVLVKSLYKEDARQNPSLDPARERQIKRLDISLLVPGRDFLSGLGPLKEYEMESYTTDSFFKEAMEQLVKTTNDYCEVVQELQKLDPNFWENLKATSPPRKLKKKSTCSLQ